MAFQSCPFWWQATHSIATTTSDFSIPLSSPSSIRFTAMSVIGYGWTWQLPIRPTTYWLPSCNKAFALSPRTQINHALLHFGWSKISGPRSKRLCMMDMGGNFNPGAEAEHQGKGSSNSHSNDPLSFQHDGNLRSKWLLGSPLLGIKICPIRH